jgi:hypothetical protein
VTGLELTGAISGIKVLRQGFDYFLGPPKVTITANGLQYKLGMGFMFTCYGANAFQFLSKDSLKYGVEGILVPWGDAGPGQYMISKIDEALEKLKEGGGGGK